MRLVDYHGVVSSTKQSSRVLLITGPDRVAQLTKDALAAAGHKVTVVEDPTALNAVAWNRAQENNDAVVWCGGGIPDSPDTRAVDRDAPWSMIDSLNRLDDRPQGAPLLVLLSIAGSLQNQWPKDDARHAFGLAKQEVDRRLEAGVKFPYAVVAAGPLVDAEADKLVAIADEPTTAPTSRGLVAAKIATVVSEGAAALPEQGVRLPVANA